MSELDLRWAHLSPQPRLVSTIPEEHSLLGASGSHKWLHCPASARLEAQFPDSQSEYAAEGHLAHALAELILRKKYTVMKPSIYKKELADLKSHKLYSPEMDGYVEVYTDHIIKTATAFPAVPTVLIEQRLDYSQWVPEGFGTGDCILLYDTILHINDLKYGKGVPVSAHDNPQMKLYALGAWSMFAFLYDIKVIRMSIIQPRCGGDSPVSTFEMPVEDLLAWGESIKPVAVQAWEGKGEFCAGPWCKDAFCRASRTCRARCDHYASLVEWGNAKPPLINNAELGEILAKAEGLAAWVKDLESYALDECLAGREVPGWKAVEGRSNRVITDVDAAIAAFHAAGFDEALFYKRSPVAMGEMEKILGKQKTLLEPFTIKPPGKPALAPASDSRQPFTRTTAEEAFKDIPATQ